MKVLIANRSEIALRVERTCLRLGIECVFVYAEDDPWQYAIGHRCAVSLGVGPAAETYLNQQKLISIAKEYNCKAIHPGFGFLSENASFSEAVEKAGLSFIGAPAHAIREMGDKIRSKHWANKAGVPVIPGYDGEDQSAETLKKRAQEIELPLLIKASAGGGGKGMRVVEKWSDFDQALSSARSEALKSFGDDRVLLEKWIENPHHIEIQVLSDQHGHHNHVFERECSIQRRYQKIFEEAPSPSISNATRENMYRDASALAAAIDYVGAGTVEFVVDQSQNYFFLEMNTRLQVEHPVTEEITGLDLVELQLLAAAGEEIDLQGIQKEGHSIEVRLYAEDPWNNFLPTAGRFCFAPPVPPQDVRYEHALVRGMPTSLDYDPMVAKVVAWGQDRLDCLENLHEGLAQFSDLGVRTNRGYLLHLIEHEAIQEGDTNTGFIGEYHADLEKARRDFSLVRKFDAIASSVAFNGMPEFGLHHVDCLIDGELLHAKLEVDRSHWTIQVDGNRFQFGVPEVVGDRISIDGRLRFIATSELGLKVDVDGEHLLLEWRSSVVESTASLDQLGAITAPMPGKVFSLKKSVGDRCSKGEVVAILEAMKMEHPLTAPESGVVESISASVGQLVNAGDTVLTIGE